MGRAAPRSAVPEAPVDFAMNPDAHAQWTVKEDAVLFA
jgi:hypothetical protein